MARNAFNKAGWDIGGAHVKLAYIDDNTLHVQQWDCPLWKGLDELVAVLQTALKKIPDNISAHNVTMTGELVDLFLSRDQGVKEIVRVFLEEVSSEDIVRFYSRRGLLDYKEALLDTLSVASVNWIASGRCVSKKNKTVIFVDMGSTTTDVLLIKDGQLQLNGVSDFERLRSGELVYTGVVRSCVNTICQKIPYKGDWIPLMAEYFSMSADVYRILDWLPSHADYGDTLDSQPKDKTSSMRRLARMIGEDYRKEDRQEWVSVAQYIADQQIEMVKKSLLKFSDDRPMVVGAGVGRFLVERIAKTMSLDYEDFTRFIIPEGISYQVNASDCAPAVSLVFE